MVVCGKKDFYPIKYKEKLQTRPPLSKNKKFSQS